MLVAACCCAGALAAEDGVEQTAGSYELWEDFEGGTVCPIDLEAEPTIGGYALNTTDEACFGAFKLDGDPYAWYLDGEGGLVLADAARQVLVRLLPVENGFHADRSADGLESLNLTPAE